MYVYEVVHYELKDNTSGPQQKRHVQTRAVGSMLLMQSKLISLFSYTSLEVQIDPYVDIMRNKELHDKADIVAAGARLLKA